MTQTDDAAVLRRALDQLADLLAEADPESSSDPTPCAAWTVGDLVDHIVAAPERFARMARGLPIDWAAPTPPAGSDPAGTFRSSADDLLVAWDERDESAAPPGIDWLCAEFAVHTWDLATALHRPSGDLDREVAERGLAFMRDNLTPENRGEAFGPAHEPPDDADAYQRIAAFAGRAV
jgi:uncharacterized protein (TIGR03086 family)